MRGLTLIRPWPHAIVALGKRCENRSWEPAQCLLDGELLAIHAGLGWQEDSAEYLRTLGPCPPKAEHPSGAIVAVARVTGYTDDSDDQRISDEQCERWCSGPIVWLLDDVRPLRTPVKSPKREFHCGLWRVKPATERLVLAQLDSVEETASEMHIARRSYVFKSRGAASTTPNL